MTSIIFVAFLLSVVNAIELEINQGKLLGKTSLDIKNKPFHSFLSIPYAKAPLGKLRFKAPVETEPWEGVLNATVPVPYCPQLSFGEMLGQEDCLYLNVYTPKIPNKTDDANDELLPVMFYIHGGGFIEGTSALRGADYLMPAGVILVTINYRLGLLGFISSQDPILNVPGNAGLKDQTMALKWVQTNIKHFGGDPDNVTIFGCSAGGVSTHFHMLSPLSRGLFHKVIAISGNAGNQWSHGVLGTFETKAKVLGIYDDKDKKRMLKQFQKVPVLDILKTQRQNGYMLPIYEPFESSPVVEAHSEGAFLEAAPLKLISSGNFSKVPFMFGYTSAEGLVYEVVDRLYTGKPFIPKNFTEILPHNFDLSARELIEYEASLKDFYYGGEEPSEDNLRNTTDLVTDVWFTSGIMRLIDAMQDYDHVYFYRFSADTELNFIKKETPETTKAPGACHADDLGYIVPAPINPPIIAGSKEEQAVENTVRLYTNFAKYGKPTLPDEVIQWLPLSKSALNYMDIDVVLSPGVDPDKERYAFWRNIYKTFKVKY